MKQKFNFEIDLDEMSITNVNCALRIDREFFYNELKNKISDVSQQMILTYADSKLKQDELMQKEEIKDSLNSSSNECKTEVYESESKKIKKYDSITYKYADKEWKRKAIDAVVEASKKNLFLTPNEIFKIVGISLTLKNRFKRPLGGLMKNSGIKSRKYFANGTTVTEYYI